MPYAPEPSTKKSDPAVRKIVVIHPHPLVLEAVCDLIEQANIAAEVHRSTSQTSILDIAPREQIALIIFGDNVTRATVSGLIALMRMLAPTARLAVLSRNSDGHSAANTHGVTSLSMDLPCEEIFEDIRDLLNQCGFTERQDVDQTAISRNDNHLLESLSSRQLEILKLLARGLTNHEIAKTQNISVETIKTHLHGIYQKLGVKNRTQAVLRYLEDRKHK